MSESWLDPHLTALLRDRLATLDHWRRQIPALSGRAKDFENWLLVELVDRLSGSGLAREVRTNGHFTLEKVRASAVNGLRGSKARALHLSADLSLRLQAGDRVVSAEIKTGLARREILDDLRIVRYYNRAVSDQAELAWVVLVPLDDVAGRSAVASFERTYSALQQAGHDFVLLRREAA